MSDDDMDELWEDADETDVWTASTEPDATSVEERLGGGQTVMSIAISVVAVLMGGMALFMNFTGGNNPEMDVTRRAVLEAANQMEDVEEELNAMKAQLDALEAKLAALEAGQAQVAQRADAIAGQTQAAFDRFGEEVQRNRLRLEDLRAATLARPHPQPTPSPAPRPANDPPASGASPPASQASSPPAAANPTDSVPQDRQIHKVESGDVLWNLARRYGVSVDALILANPGVDPDRLRPGMELIIPSQ